ncbi:3-hydroxyanthranilic acid dioxygenase [Ascobolus immersus RN42]|uniref:3-hydroxyanthranilate 3,4-dioxygenase n=1 Tax=Ascobolus immersus RN42 TaxID=1160509 RepID=A0A3N4IQB8_ASCIM|nr:3-hydroxyanthranilic acid dioxygenase [Ascobolus immersus RN42]
MPPLNLPSFLPFNIQSFLETNAHLLAPPINNTLLYQAGGMTVMLVGGPNARNDFHINVTPEFFYQVKGGMVLRVMEPLSEPDEKGRMERRKDIRIGEGELFFLPGNTPHNPIRFADTVGIVIELARPEGSVDRLRWYCEREECGEVVFEDSFVCTDLGTQIKAAVQAYAGDEEKRRCSKCGGVNGVAGPAIEF